MPLFFVRRGNANKSVSSIIIFKLVMSTKKGTDIETVVQILFKKSSMNLKASQESWGRVAIMVCGFLTQ